MDNPLVGATVPLSVAMTSTELLSRDGRAVFPCMSLGERSVLNAVACLHGLTIKLADGEPVDALAGTGRGEPVVAVGTDALEAARLYAHLTGRPLLHVGCARDVLDIEQCSVLVGLTQDIPREVGYQLLQRSHAQGFLPGVISAGEREGLALLAKRFALALHGRHRPTSGSCSIVPAGVLAGVRSSCDPARTEVGPCIGSPFETDLALLLVHTHWVEAADAELRAWGLHCLARGYCSKAADLSFRQQAWLEGQCMERSDAPRARCLIVTVDADDFDRGLSGPVQDLALRIAHRAIAGAVVFVRQLRPKTAEVDSILALVGLVVDGVPLGKAISRWLALPEQAEAHVCLLGDPGYGLLANQPECPQDHVLRTETGGPAEALPYS
jgi:hypothetical protein